MRHLSRFGWLLIGLLALLLGIIGIPLPLLPTTPFILLAAFCFARSSERLHRWLVEHRYFGRVIDDWYRYGAISQRGKTWALVSMAAILLLSVVLEVPAHAILIQAAVLGATSIFIVTRPSPPGRE